VNVLVNYLSAVSGGAIAYLRNVTPVLHRLFLEIGGEHRLKILLHESQLDLVQDIPSEACIVIAGARPTGYQRLAWEYSHIPKIVGSERIEVLFSPCQIGPQVPRVQKVFMLGNMEPFLSSGYQYSFPSTVRNYLLKIGSVRTLRKANRVIAISRFTKDFVTRRLRVREERMRMIYHGRDMRFSPEGDEGSDRKLIASAGVIGNFILTCGSLLPYRRCEDVIEAFRQFAEFGFDDVELVVAGTGTDSRYARLIDTAITQSGCSQKIKAVGHVDQKVMAALYRRCRLCVLASEIEACPTIAIEAMASGCVIVSCDRPPFPEIFDGCSLEYHARDITDLKKKIEIGLNDKKIRADAKSKALIRAQAFSWDKCARETFSALVDWEKI
jgi:glycosyltransferase involved in cell wall biosynthesis